MLLSYAKLCLCLLYTPCFDFRSGCRWSLKMRRARWWTFTCTRRKPSSGSCCSASRGSRAVRRPSSTLRCWTANRLAWRRCVCRIKHSLPTTSTKGMKSISTENSGEITHCTVHQIETIRCGVASMWMSPTKSLLSSLSSGHLHKDTCLVYVWKLLTSRLSNVCIFH